MVASAWNWWVNNPQGYDGLQEARKRRWSILGRRTPVVVGNLAAVEH